MKVRHLTLLLALLGVLVAACDSGEVELSTTSSLLTGTTESPDPADTTTTTGEVASPSTTLRGETVTSYEVAARIPGDNGDTLYIVIPEGAYTDVDLENFVGDLLEADPELWGIEVFDSEEGPGVIEIAEDQRTEEQKQMLDEHHFVSLVDGDRLVFRGPFAEFGEMIIGS